MAFLWKISKENHSNSYLFGTIHAICKDAFLLPENVQHAIEVCDSIWLEIDLNDAQNQAQSFMLMQNEIPLEEALSTEDFQWFQTEIIERFDLDYESIRYLKPIFILYQLTSYFIPCETVSFEEKIIRIALQHQKEIHGLSSLEEQYALGDESFSYEDFLHTIRHMHMSDFKQMYAAIIQAYTDEDSDKLQTLIKEQSFENDKIQSILLEKRNKLWSETLQTILPKNSAFIAVGVAHISGENGLISLLQQDGFLVTKQ